MPSGQPSGSLCERYKAEGAQGWGGGGVVWGLPASANAAAGAFKEQEAPAVRTHQVDVNWRPPLSATS